MMNQLVKSPDFTWAMSKVFIWSCCEPFIGIVCACLPTYAPLVRKWWTASHSRRDNSYKISEPKGNSNGMSGKPQVLGGSGYISDKPSRREWSRGLHSMGDTTLRGDDEIELTVDISGREISRGKESPDGMVGYKNEIMVRKDFSWERSQV